MARDNLPGHEAGSLTSFASLWGLTKSETARALNIDPETLEEWYQNGVPAERGYTLAQLVAATDMLTRRIKRERIPGVVRRPASDLGGRSLYGLACEGQHAQVLAAITRLFDLRRGEARAVAEAPSTAEDRFVEFVTRELRSPLCSIDLYADMIEREAVGPTAVSQRLYVKRIKAAAHHLNEMIGEVLSYSRLEAGAGQMYIEPINATKIASEVTKPLRLQAEAKGLAFRYRLPDHPVEMDGDAGKLRLILTNLLSNAIKRTEQGEILLEIEESAGWVLFQVRDTGAGIALQDRERIFLPFWPAEENDPRHLKGIGLALAVCRRFARSLGGDVEVESTPDLGNTFTLHLPLRKQKAS